MRGQSDGEGQWLGISYAPNETKWTKRTKRTVSDGPRLRPSFLSCPLEQPYGTSPKNDPTSVQAVDGDKRLETFCKAGRGQ